MNLENRVVGREGEIEFLRYLARRRDTTALRDVSYDPHYFQDDIDIEWYTSMRGENLFNRKDIELRDPSYLSGGDGRIDYLLNKEINPLNNDRRVTIEVKTDTKHLFELFQNVPCFVIQVLYDTRTGMPGWIYRTSAHRLVIFDSEIKRFFTFNTNKFREYIRWLHENSEKTTGFMGTRLADIPQRGAENINRCLYVPRHLITDKVNDGANWDYSVIRP